MAVGYSGTQTALTLNNQAGMLATRLRAICQAIDGWHEGVVALGHTGLMAAGYSDADATRIAYLADVIATVSAVYNGRAGQTPPFNFDNELAELCGTAITG